MGRIGRAAVCAAMCVVMGGCCASEENVGGAGENPAFKVDFPDGWKVVWLEEGKKAAAYGPKARKEGTRPVISIMATENTEEKSASEGLEEFLKELMRMSEGLEVKEKWEAETGGREGYAADYEMTIGGRKKRGFVVFAAAEEMTYKITCMAEVEDYERFEVYFGGVVGSVEFIETDGEK